MRHPHLAEVVEVGAKPDRGLRGVVELEPARDGEGALRHTLAVAIRVAVRRFDRLPPLAHHVEVGGLELRDLAADVDEIDACIESLEQTVRGVEERQRVLVSAHRLHQQRELAGRLRFVQDRAGTDRQIHRRPEARLGKRRPAGLAVHHADHLVRFGFVGAGIELIEDRERCLGVPPRLLVPLAHEVRFGMIHEAHTLQMRVVLPQIGMRDTKVDVRQRAAVFVIGGDIGFHGALVMRDRAADVAFDVVEHAEVLLDTRPELPTLATARERLEEVRARIIHRARPDGQAPHRVQRLGGEDLVADLARSAVARAAHLARPRRLVAVMEHNGEPPHGLGDNRFLTRAFGGGNRPFVPLNRFRDTRVPLAGPRFEQQIGGGTRRDYHAMT